ncbi:MAG: hypothetical protein AAGL18_06125 [Pseudomonadota bacterium]
MIITNRFYVLTAIGGMILGVAGCATVATQTLENRLQTLGLPAGTATCMANDLGENLSQDDLIDLTRYTYSLTTANSAVEIVRSLMEIENPRAVTAVGQAGFTCLRQSFFG